MVRISDLSTGLHLIRQKTGKFGVDHYAILDSGDILHIEGRQFGHPIIIHQSPPQIQMDYFNSSGNWEVIGTVRNEFLDEAIVRINHALLFSDYNLFSNNCEQFARYIAEGKRYSTQLRAGVALTAFAGFIIWAVNNPE
jgi:hypothetical protein